MKMTVNYGWLCELVEGLDSKSYEEVGLALTALGAETEDTSILNFGEKTQLAQIISFEPLKGKNSKVIVEAQGKQYILVSNSPILEVNQYVIFAPIDHTIFGGNIISSREIDGIKTEGLLLALENLGIEEKSTDILYLGKDLEIAQEIFDAFTSSDAVYTLDVPGNRADWLSVRGLARALSIYFDTDMIELAVDTDSNSQEIFPITIETDLCHRFSTRIIRNIHKKTSEPMIQKWLYLLGMRPLNLFVDMSNFIMLETGQPTHAFALDKVKGSFIIRQAKEGETLTLLDGTQINLVPEDIIICDEEKILTLAGIMGGESSKVDDSTTDIILESANFHGTTIRRSSKRHGIKTESSLRFEKNISSELVSLAANAVTLNLQHSSSETIIGEFHDIYKKTQQSPSIIFSPEYARKYLGAMDIENEFIQRIIIDLGCALEIETEEKWIVTPNGERSDLKIQEDLIEEIARFYGYDNIPTSSYHPSSIQLNPEKSFDEKIRPLLRGMGLSEAITIAFRNQTQREYYSLNINPVSIKNPLNTDWTELRTHLFDGLLDSIKLNNAKAFTKNIALSEIGTVFKKENSNFIEEKKLSFVISNEENPYDKALNIYQNIMIYSKCIPEIRRINTAEYPFLHPKNGFEIIKNNKVVGFFGEIHPLLSEKLNLSDKVDFPIPVVCEISFDILKETASFKTTIENINELPPMFRDITLTIPQDTLGQEIQEKLRNLHKDLKDIEFLSVFQNEALKERKLKNISLKLRFESSEPLESTEIDSFIKNILSKSW